MKRLWLTLVAACGTAVLADDTILNSKHDLSAMGPGPVRSLNEDQVCVFCHAPHNTDPATPLWNRYNPTAYYRIYRSPSLDARADQPGPASKLCLSCHDGTIALGLTLDRPITDPILMTSTFMPSGPSNLTTDLSDDHPVGFRYDRALANRDPQLRAPQLVDHRVPLGRLGELECTACHDPHNNELGNFLRITEREGALCRTCHDMLGWELSAHRLSPRTVPITATNGQQLPYRSMSENACLACHVTHSAPWREQLLYDRPTILCLNCHDGVGAQAMLPVIDQRFGHRINRLVGHRRDPEDRLRAVDFVECPDCHNPHAVARDVSIGPLAEASHGPLLPAAMRAVPGVSIAGVPVEPARLYYEVCFRCHGDLPVRIADRIIRQRDDGGNVRRQFSPTAASAHPVAVPSRGLDEVPSLRPDARGRRFVSCQDCHNNPDGRSAGGLGPDGPHTSRYPFLLVERYETRDYTIETPQAYALCYACHDRNSILGDESFALHRVHVVRGRSPCSACHTAHGVSGSSTQHSHLINFDLAIVEGQRLYVDTGRFSGSCTLTCHGVVHVNFTYAR